MKTVFNIQFGLMIAAGLLMMACGGETPLEEEHGHEHEDASDVVEFTEAQYQSAEIGLGNFEMRTISGTIPASGFLDVPPQSKVSISAPMGGFIKSTTLLQGSQVKKGQVVAVVQHQDYIKLQQDYLENFNRLPFLKSEFERQEKLAAENVNSKKAFEEAQANYLTAKSTVEGLKSTLEMLNISVSRLEKGEIQNTVNLYAPISGYVTKVNTNIGAFVNPTDVLFEIVNTENLHVELTIFEKDIPSVQIGQRVLFTLSNEAQSREATVQLIGREISQDRSVQVHCEIEKADKELIPGMYLQALLETDSAKVTALPEDAVIHFEGKDYIFILMNEQEEGHNHSEAEEEHTHSHEATPGNASAEEVYHFKMIEVTKGESENGYVEIILPEGVDLHSSVVVKGAYNVMSKMKNSEEEGHSH